MNTIKLFGLIGAGGVNAAAFIDKLTEAGPGPVVVEINSTGGDVFEAVAIFNALRRHGNVTTRVVALAASAASIVALGGKRVEIARGALMMVHSASSSMSGTAAELRDHADLLEKVSAQLADIYATRTGKTAAEVVAWLARDTWFDADEAKAAGLVDEIVDGFGAIAAAWSFSSAPAAIAARLDTEAPLRAEIVRLEGELTRAKRDAVTARIDADLGGMHLSTEARGALVDTLLANEAGGRALLANMARQARAPIGNPPILPEVALRNSNSDEYAHYLSRLPKQ